MCYKCKMQNVFKKIGSEDLVMKKNVKCLVNKGFILLICENNNIVEMWVSITCWVNFTCFFYVFSKTNLNPNPNPIPNPILNPNPNFDYQKILSYLCKKVLYYSHLQCTLSFYRVGLLVGAIPLDLNVGRYKKDAHVKNFKTCVSKINSVKWCSNIAYYDMELAIP